MAQPYQQQLKIRTGVYVFLKETNKPVVLYFDNPKGTL